MPPISDSKGMNLLSYFIWKGQKQGHDMETIKQHRATEEDLSVKEMIPLIH